MPATLPDDVRRHSASGDLGRARSRTATSSRRGTSSRRFWAAAAWATATEMANAAADASMACEDSPGRAGRVDARPRRRDTSQAARDGCSRAPTEASHPGPTSSTTSRLYWLTKHRRRRRPGSTGRASSRSCAPKGVDPPGRCQRVPRRDLHGPQELGGEGVPEPRPLQRG